MRFKLCVADQIPENKKGAGSILKYESQPEFDTSNSKDVKHLKQILATQNHTMMHFQNDNRGRKNITIGIGGLMIDVERINGIVTSAELEQLEKFLKDFNYFKCTSASHKAKNPRWHYYLPFEKVIELSQDEIEAKPKSNRFRKLLKLERQKFIDEGFGNIIDHKTFEPKRHFYPNFCAKDSQFELHDTGSYYKISSTPNDIPSGGLHTASGGTSNDEFPVPENKYLNDNWIELDKYCSYCAEYPLTKGERDDEFVRLAAKFRQCSYSKEQTFKILNKFNKECVVKKHRLQSTGTPLSDDKTIEQVVDHVWETKMSATEPKTGWPKMLDAINNESPSPLFDLDFPDIELPETFKEKLNKMKPAFGVDGFYSVGERIKAGIYNKPPVTAVLGLVVFGSSTILVGESGDGKTTLAISAAIQEMRNHNRTTVFIIAETDPRPDHTWENMLGSKDCESIYLFDVRLLKKEIPVKKRFKYICDLILKARPDFVVFDTLHSVFGWMYDENLPDVGDAIKWQKLAQKLGQMAIVAGSTPLILHHPNKSGKYAGSAGLKAGGDNMLYFNLFGKKKNCIRKITIEKSRDGLTEFFLKADAKNNYHYKIHDIKNDDDDDGDDKIKLSKDDRKIFDILKSGKQFTHRALLRLCRNLNKKSLDKILETLEVHREIKNKTESVCLTKGQIKYFK